MTAELCDREELAFASDVNDILSNPRVSLRAAVTALPYKERRCRKCDARLPAGAPCAELRFGTARKKWSWHFCLDCAPIPVEPLAEHRALRFLSRAFAQRTLAAVSPAAWAVLSTMRPANCPF